MSTAIGTRQMSYTMQPMNQNGQIINHGMSYANARTVEDARDYAARVMNGAIEGATVRAVSISGRLMEFAGHAWVAVRGSEAQWFSETIKSDAPYDYSAADLAKRCYPSTVMDYFEIVHETRGDGTCHCGNPTRTR